MRRIPPGIPKCVFASSILLGMQFAPRLRDLGDQQLYRMSREQQARHLAPRFKGTIQQDFILRHWDDLLRLAGLAQARLGHGLAVHQQVASLSRGRTSSPGPCRNMAAWSRRSLSCAIWRVQTIAGASIAQLNKGESLHALRDFLFVADKGVIRRKQ